MIFIKKNTSKLADRNLVNDHCLVFFVSFVPRIKEISLLAHNLDGPTFFFMNADVTLLKYTWSLV